MSPFASLRCVKKHTYNPDIDALFVLVCQHLCDDGIVDILHGIMSMKIDSNYVTDAILMHDLGLSLLKKDVPRLRNDVPRSRKDVPRSRKGVPRWRKGVPRSRKGVPRSSVLGAAFFFRIIINYYAPL
ncbi:hypothetical protein BDC45DRAFT_596143 [Circinella umbellata]|nr:hypothetical protein BDC45DRAFT_596143 [Circinella umbellata]